MIHLIDNYGVLVDDYNYTLVQDTGRTRTNKNGSVEKVYKYYGYFRNLNSAVEACRRKFVHDELKDADVSLSEAVHTIKSVTDRFTEVLERCFPEDDLK